MNKHAINKLRNLIIAAFFAEGLLGGLIIFCLVLIGNGSAEQLAIKVLVIVGLSFGVSLFAAGIGVISNLFWKRSNYLHRSTWIRELVDADVDIMVADDFERRAGRENAKVDHEKKKLVACIGLFAYRGQPIAGYGQGHVHSFNQIAIAALEKKFKGNEHYFYAINNQNVYMVYGVEKYPDEFTKAIQSVCDSINKEVALQPSLPPLYVLTGFTEVNLDESAYDSLKRALFAMNYRPAARLSGDIKQYEDHMTEVKERNKELDGEIARAIKRHELILYYQPKWDVKNKTFYGCEALIRWRHPQRGFLPPSIFIPAAESSGKIIDIDHYVFDTICRDISKWKVEKRKRIVVSVNLSRRSIFDSNLISFISETVAKYDIDPSQIEIELTESMAAQFTDQIRHVILKLKSLGFSTSMDDFGVGYSSLSSIKKIPFDVLKLDKSFIDDIEKDETSGDFVGSIIGLVHSMKIFVIAEGVETDKEVNILSSKGLDAIQGYYFSRPLDRETFEEFIIENKFEHSKEDR